MYIWMMLAAFIVMLAAFNLSPRSDLHSQQQTPLAEAAITKFLVQHDAAIRYAKKTLALKHDNPSAYAGLSEGAISGCNEENNGDLCGFLPVGFKYEENLYYSKVYYILGRCPRMLRLVCRHRSLRCRRRCNREE